MELAASGVEGVLLLLGDARLDERSAFVVDGIEKSVPDGFAPQIGIVVTASDDFAAKHPKIVAVPARGLGWMGLHKQMEQKGLDELDDACAEGNVGLFVAPALHPVAQVRARFGQCVGTASAEDNRLGRGHEFATVHLPDQCQRRGFCGCSPAGQERAGVDCT